MTIKTPQHYKDSLNEINTRYLVILKEVTNSFPYAKAYSDLSKYTDIFANNESNLDKLNADLFKFKSSIQQDIQTVASDVSKTLEKISLLEKQNQKLNSQITSLDNQSKGAIGMFDDSRETYNFHRAENIVYFIVLCSLSLGIYKNIHK
jgi:cell division protein FtsB